MAVRLGVDVGGTFTDLVAVVEGEIITAKVPSTEDQSEGVLHAFERTGLAPAAVTVFAHGMTVATNALLEAKGAPTALITTEGFRDVLLIGRQNRPHLYDLARPKPVPLVPRERCLTVRERMGPEGVITPLDLASLAEVIETLRPGVREGSVMAIAVGLLFSFRYPEHEREIGRVLRDAFAGLHVSLSSEVAPEFREYERFSTAVVDAYLSPRLEHYLAHLAARCTARGLPLPVIMQSSGGVTTIEHARAHAAVALLSGPAGGVRGAAFVADQSGYADVLTFDMGGTSTDISLILAGKPQTASEAVVAGYPVRLPQIDIHTVSAGGGSIAWADGGGALRVGPHSAGSLPGPVAYGRGGTEPTVTDANLLLGYLADGAVLGGEVKLDRTLAAQAIARLGTRLDLTLERTAVGVREVANVHMAAALRVMSVERGIDPRTLVLLAFGGAGPMHGCDLAEALQIQTVLVPQAGGVLSALGMAVSDLRRDYSCPVLCALPQLTAERWHALRAQLASRAQSDLTAPVLEHAVDLRYRGQSFELTIPVHDLAGLAEDFHREHERRYGWADPQQVIEVVQMRLVASEPVELPQLRASPPVGEAGAGARTAWFGNAFVQVPVFDRTRMGAGSRVEGPALIDMPEATVVVRPGWRGNIDTCGTLVLKYFSCCEDFQTD